MLCLLSSLLCSFFVTPSANHHSIYYNLGWERLLLAASPTPLTMIIIFTICIFYFLEVPYSIPTSKTVNFDDGLCKLPRRFLRQVVPDPALDDPVCVFAGEFPCVGAAVGVWRSVGITFESDGGVWRSQGLRRVASQDRHTSTRLQPDRAASDSYG